MNCEDSLYVLRFSIRFSIHGSACESWSFDVPLQAILGELFDVFVEQSNILVKCNLDLSHSDFSRKHISISHLHVFTILELDIATLR